jgi:hypothetical protein
MRRGVCVARVRLYLMAETNDPVFRFIRAGGVSDSIPALRLRALVNLKQHIRTHGSHAAGAAYPKCIIDTGSHLSLIPEYIWSHFYR